MKSTCGINYIASKVYAHGDQYEKNTSLRQEHNQKKGTLGSTSADDATHWYLLLERPSRGKSQQPVLLPSLHITHLLGVLNVAWPCDLGQVSCPSPQYLTCKML